MKKNILVTITSITIIILFSMQLIVSNRLTTMGAELSTMQQQTEDFHRENEQLQHKIASESSLLKVSQEAEKLGFSRADIEYLKRPPVAFNQ